MSSPAYLGTSIRGGEYRIRKRGGLVDSVYRLRAVSETVSYGNAFVCPRGLGILDPNERRALKLETTPWICGWGAVVPRGGKGPSSEATCQLPMDDKRTEMFADKSLEGANSAQGMHSQPASPVHPGTHGNAPVKPTPPEPAPATPWTPNTERPERRDSGEEKSNVHPAPAHQLLATRGNLRRK